MIPQAKIRLRINPFSGPSGNQCSVSNTTTNANAARFRNLGILSLNSGARNSEAIFTAATNITASPTHHENVIPSHMPSAATIALMTRRVLCPEIPPGEDDVSHRRYQGQGQHKRGGHCKGFCESHRLEQLAFRAGQSEDRQK